MKRKLFINGSMMVLLFAFGSFSYVWAQGGGTSVTVTADYGYTTPAPLKASFTDQSIAAINSPFGSANTNANSWLWDFGDGSTSILKNPDHTYASAGTYTVCLIAKFDTTIITQTISDSDTICKLVTVSSSQCAYAGFTHTDNYFDITFADASTNGSSTITTWSWDFGDGSTSTLKDPTHTYASANTYTVCLTVGDGGSCSQQACQNVVVIDNACTASYTSSANGLDVTFVDASTAMFQGFPAKQLIDSWSWDFGDGQTANGVDSVVHTYASAGTYTACVTSGSSVMSCSNTYCTNVTVTPIGINDIDAGILAVKLYPNPAKGIVTYEYELVNNSKVDIFLTDLMGKRIHILNEQLQGSGLHKLPMDITKLGGGIYMLTVIVNNRMHIEKLTVIK